MLSMDTNILLYAQNSDCSENARALDFLSGLKMRSDVVICELVLVELYALLRNPAIFARPMGARDAAALCQHYRQNPNWRLVENASIMDDVWKSAERASFPRRRIFDARIGFTLRHHGVTEFATANTKDFEGMGFLRVWNPLT